jgi:hypothetical protein
MKPAKKFAHVQRRFYRPEVSHCQDYQKRLQRAVTLSERTVITLEGVMKLAHAGYRCPDPQCEGHRRTYRSAQADALTLPWFTYELGVITFFRTIFPAKASPGTKSPELFPLSHL